MSLSREHLLLMATDGYFGNVGRKDIAKVMAPFAENAVMTVVAGNIHYDGKAAIHRHFEDFCSAYTRIKVDILHAFADARALRAAVHFEITLESPDGSSQTMRNANHFRFTAEGQIDDVLIFMTGTPGDGFDAGNSA